MSLAPQPPVSDAECEAGLHRLVGEAAWSSATASDGTNT